MNALPGVIDERVTALALEAQKAANAGEWRTINGAHVLLKDGVVVKGPAHLMGTKPSNVARAGDVKLKPSKTRAWNGEAVALKTKLSKQEVGAIGEKVATAYLHATGMTDAGPANTEHSNFPIDVRGDHTLTEVKTGLASNTRSAGQWRATIGEPGPTEKAWLKTADPEDKAAWNAKKSADIMARKAAVVRDFSKREGGKFKGQTVTVILNTDTRTADVFKFAGFHQRISWISPAAKAGYVGSYTY